MSKERAMNKRIWVGVLGGLLALSVLAGVAAAAYHVGRHDHVKTVVSNGDVTSGQVVHVVGGHWGWGYGPGPFIFFFPLLIGGLLIALIVSGRRNRPYGPGRWGYGPYGGPGEAGPGRPPAAFEEWHRQPHKSAGEPVASRPDDRS